MTLEYEQTKNLEMTNQSFSHQQNEPPILDALGICYGIKSPGAVKKASVGKVSTNKKKNIEIKTRANEDLDSIMQGTKIKIVKNIRPITTSRPTNNNTTPDHES